MKARSMVLPMASLLLVACSSTPVAPVHGAFHYPVARKGDVVDDYHGVKVADPYRWMEDLDSAEVKAWVEAENTVTLGYLEGIPAREAIGRRLTELWNYERTSVPFVEGGRIFFSRNSGLQPQSVLYVADGTTAEPRVLLDPNTLSSDGTVALSGISVSDDGLLLAYSLSTAGSDWQEWHVREVSTGRDLPDHLKWTKFTRAAWTKDGKGFYYGRFDEPAPGAEMTATNFNQRLCYHSLGAPQREDEVVYSRPDHKEWEFGPEVTEDGRYLVITVSVGTDRRNMVFYRDLADASGRVVTLLPDFDASYNFIGNDGPVFYFSTDLDAPNHRLIAIDTRNPARNAWREIVPEQKEALQGVSLVHDTLIASYLKDASTQVREFRLDGTPAGEVALPGIGSTSGFSGKRSDAETFYSFTGFTVPATIYHLDMRTGRSTVFRRPSVKFNPDEYTTEQVFTTSKDGTRVPMFLSYRKGLVRNRQNPALLYGYGGFDIAITPYFSVSSLAWMEMGGIYAVANLRGGSEYGEAWHQAGMLANKQHVFDDFIAAAEWLIANRYTSSAKLAISGASNGGLLVGAVLDQRPDLFGAALPDVGVMDMLRFDEFTIGWAWVSEYGSSGDPKMFPVLRAYSPLHNVKPGTCYPPTLITTADHDDRVVPAHSFKYAASLQAAQGCGKEVLIRIETRAGHGAGKPTAKLIEETTDRLAFLTRALHVRPPAS